MRCSHQISSAISVALVRYTILSLVIDRSNGVLTTNGHSKGRLAENGAILASVVWGLARGSLSDLGYQCHGF